MKIRYYILTLITFLISCHLISQNRVQLNSPTVKTESEYIWSIIQDIKFFEEHAYQVRLPKGDLLKELKLKSRSENLISVD